MTRKEKFLALASSEETDTVERAKARLARGRYTRVSKKIAIRILIRLDELGWRQVDLAKKMNVSPQQVSKWVKGKENFKLETISNLGSVLGIDLISVDPLSKSSIQISKTFEKDIKSDISYIRKYAVVPGIKNLPLEKATTNNQYEKSAA